METKKIVLVTGASQGIGRAICDELSLAGYQVIGAARTKIDASFESHVCDVSDEKSVDELSEKIHPDIIICAAGICEKDYGPYNHDMVRKTMEINFFGTMNFVKSFPKAQHIISISSISAFRPNRRSVSYSASKAAIGMAFRGLTLNVPGTIFSTVYLGPVNTAMWEGKKSWIVAEPKEIAKKIAGLVKQPKNIVYMPFVSTTLYRISLLIPDTIYAKLSKILFK